MSTYIKFDGIEGECLDKDHIGWTEVDSVTHGSSKPSAASHNGSPRGRGDVHVHDFSVAKKLDKSSPKLMEAIFNGKVFKDVKIDLTSSISDGGRVKYLEFILEHVQVTNHNFMAHSDTVPTLHFALNFENFKVVYTEHDEKGKKKGSLATTWNRSAGKK